MAVNLSGKFGHVSWQIVAGQSGSGHKAGEFPDQRTLLQSSSNISSFFRSRYTLHTNDKKHIKAVSLNGKVM
jgi:hypothetical protein